MIEATIYYLENGEVLDRTTCFPLKTEVALEKHLTSIYGSDKMDNVFWDIWEPEEEDGLEEVETDPETEVGKYLKKMRRKNLTKQQGEL
jgi:hypothetical protein